MTRASNITASYDTDIFLSASQIGTWNQCKRKWGYSYLDRIKTPSHPSAELGQRVHAILEAWLRDGTAFDLSTQEGQIAAAGLQHLPLPGTAEVEQGFVVQTEAAKYRGFIDARFRDELPVILDHKTTSDLRWAKTEEDLRKDVQATLYAAEAMLRTGSDAVELRWIYYTTRKPYKSRKVSLIVVKDEIEANFDAIDRTAAEMLTAYRDNRSGSELPASPTACGAFGGCPYLALKVCTLSPKDMLRAHLESDSQGRNSTMSMSLAEKLKERKQWRPHPDHPGFEFNPATNETRPITTQHHAAPPAPPAVAPPAPPGPMFAATPPPPPTPSAPPAAPPSPPLAAASPPPPPAPPAPPAPVVTPPAPPQDALFGWTAPSNPAAFVPLSTNATLATAEPSILPPETPANPHAVPAPAPSPVEAAATAAAPETKKRGKKSDTLPDDNRAALSAIADALESVAAALRRL